MKPLTSGDVLALYNLARADRCIDRASRLILAEIARAGHVASDRHLSTVGGCKQAAVAGKVAQLRNLGYLPMIGTSR